MALKKRTFSELKTKFSKKANFKPERFFDLGEAFLDATGLPGPAMGHLQMFLGHTDTGKTTALIKLGMGSFDKNHSAFAHEFNKHVAKGLPSSCNF